MRAVLSWEPGAGDRSETEPAVVIIVEPDAHLEVRDSWLAPEPAEPLWLPVLTHDGRVVWRPELPREAA